MSSFVLVDVSNYFFDNIHGPLLLPTSWMFCVHMEVVHVPSVAQGTSEGKISASHSEPTSTPVGDNSADFMDLWAPLNIPLLSG